MDSILSQSLINLDVILVDDGSLDNCGEICDEYAARDDRVRVIHKKNGGLSDARNAGLKVAKGEWILFVDSDDWIVEHCIERLYNACLAYEADMSICGISFYSEAEIREQVFFEREDVFDKYYILDYRNEIWNTAYNRLTKKELYDEIEFPYGKINEDEGTTYKLVYKCHRIVGISDCLYCYNVRQNSIMHSGMTMGNSDVLELYSERSLFFRGKNEDKLADDAVYIYCMGIVEKYRWLQRGDADQERRLRYHRNQCLKFIQGCITYTNKKKWELRLRCMFSKPIAKLINFKESIK